MLGPRTRGHSRGEDYGIPNLGLVTLIVREYAEASDFFVGTLGFDLVEDTPLDDAYEGKGWVVVAPTTAGAGSAAGTGRSAVGSVGAPQTALLLARAVTSEQRAGR
ncbi:VOC family protein [Nocardiopsis rhodophaea]|uniref:VOC family protein n=1 Tax=Nocardiopsis rhodophaea TaxID=280238 RepID=UPI0031E1E5C6